MDTKRFVLFVILGVLIGVTPLAAAPSGGWFVGGSFYGFELNGSGTISTFDNPDMEFDVKRFDAYGLVTDNYTTTENSVGLGWNDTQLPGFQLQIGYKHSRFITTRLDFFWALTKRADQYGNPAMTDGTASLAKQSTAFHQNHVRLLLDYTPFEPLQLWYFTIGVEYTEFDARLEFHFDRYLNGDPVGREYEAYEDSGSTFGLVLGSGLILPGGSENRQTYVQFTWCYAPYTNDWFAWDTDIDMGGLGAEVGFRVYFAGDED